MFTLIQLKMARCQTLFLENKIRNKMSNDMCLILPLMGTRCISTSQAEMMREEKKEEC